MLYHIKDELIVPKFHFFCMCGWNNAAFYLTCYQGDGPMVPFMTEYIQYFFKSLLQVVLEPKRLPDCTGSSDLLKIQLEDENLLFPK